MDNKAQTEFRANKEKRAISVTKAQRDQKEIKEILAQREPQELKEIKAIKEIREKLAQVCKLVELSLITRVCQLR
jgi:hypothetical protein